MSDKFSSEKLYSDDAVEETATNYEGTEIELDVNALTPAEKATLFGHLYEKGYLVKGEDDKPNEIAIGYRVKRLNNKYEFVWYFWQRHARAWRRRTRPRRTRCPHRPIR
ncbi:MAG: major tail protein [Acutalibacteraceae bacterium]